MCILYVHIAARLDESNVLYVLCSTRSVWVCFSCCCCCCWFFALHHFSCDGIQCDLPITRDNCILKLIYCHSGILCAECMPECGCHAQGMCVCVQPLNCLFLANANNSFRTTQKTSARKKYPEMFISRQENRSHSCECIHSLASARTESNQNKNLFKFNFNTNFHNYKFDRVVWHTPANRCGWNIKRWTRAGRDAWNFSFMQMQRKRSGRMKTQPECIAFSLEFVRLFIQPSMHKSFNEPFFSTSSFFFI